MNYEEFKKGLFGIKKYLPDMYQEATCSIRTDDVNGRKEEVFVIQCPDAEDEAIGLQDIYKMSTGGTVEKAVQTLAKTVSTMRTIRDNWAETVFPLIVPRRNWETADTVYRQIMYSQNLTDDLTAVFFIKTDTGTIPVPQGITATLGITDKELVNQALANLKPVITRKKDRYIVTADGVPGCAVVLKKGVLKSIAEQTGSDLFVMFTDMSYATVVPDDGHTGIKQLLAQNMLDALHTDKPALSVKIRRYSRETDKIR